MAVSDAQRAASARWEKKNRKAVACTLPRDEAEAFYAAVKEDGTSVNDVLKRWIRDYMACRADKNESCKT